MGEFALRQGRPEEADELTRIALESKRHWGYAESLIELWRDELTFTARSFRQLTVKVAEVGGAPAGVAAISIDSGVAEVELLWVRPAHMGKGLGRDLFESAVDDARAGGASSLVIVSDPNAVEFYRAMGAEDAGTVNSRPAGRRLPKLVLSLAGDHD